MCGLSCKCKSSANVKVPDFFTHFDLLAPLGAPSGLNRLIALSVTVIEPSTL